MYTKYACLLQKSRLFSLYNYFEDMNFLIISDDHYSIIFYLHIQQTWFLYLYTCTIHVHTAQRVIVTDFTDTVNAIVTEIFQHRCINIFKFFVSFVVSLLLHFRRYGIICFLECHQLRLYEHRNTDTNGLHTTWA